MVFLVLLVFCKKFDSFVGAVYDRASFVSVRRHLRRRTDHEKRAVIDRAYSARPEVGSRFGEKLTADSSAAKPSAKFGCGLRRAKPLVFRSRLVRVFAT